MSTHALIKDVPEEWLSRDWTAELKKIVETAGWSHSKAARLCRVKRSRFRKWMQSAGEPGSNPAPFFAVELLGMKLAIIQGRATYEVNGDV